LLLLVNRIQFQVYFTSLVRDTISTFPYGTFRYR